MNETMADAQITGNLKRENNLSSVEITHTTKGDTWTVKVYHEDAQIAKETAKAIEKDLRESYGKRT